MPRNDDISLILAKAKMKGFFPDLASEELDAIQGYANTLFGDDASLNSIFPKPVDMQVFTSSGTWTKPLGAKAVQVLCISGGGGGGSGRRGAAATIRAGGGGGAGGAASGLMLRASDLTATVAVTVGAGGNGGAAITVNDTDGSIGTAGSISSFGPYCRNVFGGAAGNGGTATGANGGAASTNAGGIGPSAGGGNASTTGAAGGTGGGSGSVSSGFQFAGCGGGAGGGITSANAASAGGNGGNAAYANNSGGVAGVVDAAIPTAINSPYPGIGGGAGGGAGSITTNAQAGAIGGKYGGGGGGGGASVNGFNSGAGGAGANGVVIVTTYFDSVPNDSGLWVAKGDSLTAGTGGAGTTYPGILSGLLGTTVTNTGVGGEISTQIAARANDVVTKLTATGNSIPASASVVVTTDSNIPSAQGSAISGTVAGIRGTLTYSAGTISFVRQEAVASAITIPSGSVFVTDLGSSLANLRQIIWVGRNNYTDPTTVLADIANIVANNKTGKYIVLSVLNGDYPLERAGNSAYNTLVSLNKQLGTIYGNKYLDIRRYLIDHGLADAGITPLAQDITDMAQDTVPVSLRFDTIHLTAAGYTVVGTQVYNKIVSLGWS